MVTLEEKAEKATSAFSRKKNSWFFGTACITDAHSHDIQYLSTLGSLEKLEGILSSHLHAIDLNIDVMVNELDIRPTSDYECFIHVHNNSSVPLSLDSSGAVDGDYALGSPPTIIEAKTEAVIRLNDRSCK